MTNKEFQTAKDHLQNIISTVKKDDISQIISEYFNYQKALFEYMDKLCRWSKDSALPDIDNEECAEK